MLSKVIRMNGINVRQIIRRKSGILSPFALKKHFIAYVMLNLSFTAYIVNTLATLAP